MLRQRRIVVILVLLACAGITSGLLLAGGSDPRERIGRRRFESNDAIARACRLKKKILTRIWNGYVPRRSFELVVVPRFPNYPGTFDYTGHSGPWDYLQVVPLVLYGSRIDRAGTVPEVVDLTDVYPTVGELLDVELPARHGTPLRTALKEDVSGVPRLVITIVWDGVGRNVLRRWADEWPVLASLERRGTSFVNARLGSSPSITPATHSNLGTGALPREHGIPGIEYRAEDGVVTSAFAHDDTSDMRLTTFADEIDRAMNNEPIVGMLGWKPWHLGMLGHGARVDGGDRDQLGDFGYNTIRSSPRYFSMPSSLLGYSDLQTHGSALDRRDGALDGRWMGHDVIGKHDSPAWVTWQTEAVLTMLREEAYGADATPDLFFTNYKVADVVGHVYGMQSREMAAVLRAQDRALREIVAYLDRYVRDYVLVLTADHGHTPPSEVTGGWAVNMSALAADIERHFDLSGTRDLVDKNTGAGLFLDQSVMRDAGIAPDDVTEFVNGYTAAENWEGSELPASFTGSPDDQIFSAAFMGRDLPAIMECAFGTKRPPDDAPL